MTCVKWVVAGAMALSLTGVVLRAADEAKPADSSGKTEVKEEKKPMAGGRLFQPYSKMASLSDEQKGKIVSIHKEYNAQRKELDRKERGEIMALLNDDQKKEVEKIEGERKTGAKKPADAKAPTAESDKKE